MNKWRRLRDRTGLTRQELANKLAVNGQTVRRWEKGDTEPALAYQRQLEEMVDAGQEGTA